MRLTFVLTGTCTRAAALRQQCKDRVIFLQMTTFHFRYFISHGRCNCPLGGAYGHVKSQIFEQDMLIELTNVLGDRGDFNVPQAFIHLGHPLV